MSTEETTTNEPTPAPEPSFAPPISITVRTNNLNRCELRIAGADGVAEAIVIPSDGNVYQGLHRACQPLEDMFNRILAKNGVAPAEEADVPAAPAEEAPAAKKKAAAKKAAAAKPSES